LGGIDFNGKSSVVVIGEFDNCVVMPLKNGVYIYRKLRKTTENYQKPPKTTKNWDKYGKLDFIFTENYQKPKSRAN